MMVSTLSVSSFVRKSNKESVGLILAWVLEFNLSSIPRRIHCAQQLALNFELKGNNKRYLLYVKCLVLVYSLNSSS
jgi:hypothetical protein